jgi:hypothetical protein
MPLTARTNTINILPKRNVQSSLMVDTNFDSNYCKIKH